MSGRMKQGLGLVMMMAAGIAQARHGGGGGGGGHASLGGGHGHLGGGSHHHHGGAALAAVGGGYAVYGWGWPTYGPWPVYSPYFPAVVAMGPTGFFAPWGAIAPPTPVRGPLLPPLPPRAPVEPAKAPARAVKNDPSRAAHYMKFGDGVFRAGNLKRAEERYTQARNAAPDQAAPQLRLAQVALARGRYAEAAARLRDAETAEPGWLLTAPDIQSLYGEPAEFLHQIARLESHLQSHPDDRDAWLVLGAQWFLSGRTARAADVFLRLDDPHRKPDVALAAFLFASNHVRSGAEQGGEPSRRADLSESHGPSKLDD